MTAGTDPERTSFAGAEKATGLTRLANSCRYSMQGLARLWQEEAFRQEVLAFAAGLVLFTAIGAAVADYLIFVILMLALFSAESFNTAIEELVDRVSPEYSRVGRHAKDLGSFAVFCLICANLVFVLYVAAKAGGVWPWA